MVEAFLESSMPISPTANFCKASYYRARYYDVSVGRFLSEDPSGFDDGTNFYSYTGNNPVNFEDPSGLYTLKPKKHPVPPPSPMLDKFLICLEGYVGPIVVTSTTDEVHADKGHYLGTSVDIRPPAGVSADSVFCAAGKCGAARGLNESPSDGGQPVATTQGASYHFSLVQLIKHPKTKSAIPDRPDCKPGKCSQKSGFPADGGNAPLASCVGFSCLGNRQRSPRSGSWIRFMSSTQSQSLSAARRYSECSSQPSKIYSYGVVSEP
jgi:hypothetical protein